MIFIFAFDFFLYFRHIDYFRLLSPPAFILSLFISSLSFRHVSLPLPSSFSPSLPLLSPYASIFDYFSSS